MTDENNPIGIKYDSAEVRRPFTVFIRVGDAEIGMTGLNHDQLKQFQDEIEGALAEEKTVNRARRNMILYLRGQRPDPDDHGDDDDSN